MRSPILPFQPVLRDFIRNIWYLRLFILLILFLLVVSSCLLVFAEGTNIVPNGTAGSQWTVAIGITLSNAFLGSESSYTPITVLGKFFGIINMIAGYILLGMLIWVIEQSLSEHQLKKSKYLFFPTNEDY